MANPSRRFNSQALPSWLQWLTEAAVPPKLFGKLGFLRVHGCWPPFGGFLYRCIFTARCTRLWRQQLSPCWPLLWGSITPWLALCIAVGATKAKVFSHVPFRLLLRGCWLSYCVAPCSLVFLGALLAMHTSTVRFAIGCLGWAFMV